MFAPPDLTPADTPAEPFPFSCLIQVRNADVDAMNHVNNAAYVTFLEVARTAM